MPKIALESNSIQIELTAAEAANFGFALNRTQLFRKKKRPGGGLLLELFSIDLTKTSESSEISVWIPPAVTYLVSFASQEPSTPKPGDSPSSLELESPTSLSEKHYSAASGYVPSHGVIPLGETGVPQPTNSVGEPALSSPKAVASLGGILQHSLLHEA